MTAATGAASRQIVSLQTQVEQEDELVFTDAAALEAHLRREAASLDKQAVWLLAWLDHAVLVGLVTVERVLARQALDPAYLQELRLFGRGGEWRLRRAGDSFQARRRLDGVGAAGEALEDDQSLWGTQAEPDGAGWTALLEARGIRYHLPREVRVDNLPLRLRLRHYLGSDVDGMVGVVDTRCVTIGDQRGEPLIGEGEGNV